MNNKHSLWSGKHWYRVFHNFCHKIIAKSYLGFLECTDSLPWSQSWPGCAWEWAAHTWWCSAALCPPEPEIHKVNFITFAMVLIPLVCPSAGFRNLSPDLRTWSWQGPREGRHSPPADNWGRTLTRRSAEIFLRIRQCQCIAMHFLCVL